MKSARASIIGLPTPKIEINSGVHDQGRILNSGVVCLLLVSVLLSRRCGHRVHHQAIMLG